ncbi:Kinase superfamily protein [Heracleum sosnowskyi]|uniref:Kinase superfamily protein n=1 Tax=Heracleum sosnowskyi TaxID=360622 RepID=A0AAD8GUU5_9APIA|nr:Kinase superfamily protein [Heracleum sosnowskyi]
MDEYHCGLRINSYDKNENLPRIACSNISSDDEERDLEGFRNSATDTPLPGVMDHRESQSRHLHHNVNYENKEIIELDHSDNPFFEMKASRLKPQQGEILLLEDKDQGQRCYQICESFVGGTSCTYSAVALDCPIELLTLYVGAHPSRLEQSLEDMSLWYLVQRQSKVLNLCKDNGISSRHLPEILAYGRILHSGPCKKESPKGLCDHPWCGTTILVTYPFGESLSFIVSLDGPLSSEEAVRLLVILV